MSLLFDQPSDVHTCTSARAPLILEQNREGCSWSCLACSEQTLVQLLEGLMQGVCACVCAHLCTTHHSAPLHPTLNPSRYPWQHVIGAEGEIYLRSVCLELLYEGEAELFMFVWSS